MIGGSLGRDLNSNTGRVCAAGCDFPLELALAAKGLVVGGVLIRHDDFFFPLLDNNKGAEEESEKRMEKLSFQERWERECVLSRKKEKEGRREGRMTQRARE